jgi:hypothetical protein
MRQRYPNRPSQLAVANQIEWMSGGTNIRQTVKRGRQKEALVNDAIAAWAPLHPELVLGRNKRRLATPPGMKAPIMLGWLVDGSADWIGYRSIVVTPDMLGKRIAQFVAVEAKRPDGGVLSKEQEGFLNALKDAGGCCGVATCAQSAEAILSRWRAG